VVVNEVLPRYLPIQLESVTVELICSMLFCLDITYFIPFNTTAFPAGSVC
jgi:hypothetical protein